MAKKKSNMPWDEGLNDIHRRFDEEKFKVQRASSLLKILAEHCQENRHNDPDEAWFEAEYLADRLAEHVEAMGKISEEIDHFAGEVYRANHGIEPPARSPHLEVVPTDGDAA